MLTRDAAARTVPSGVLICGALAARMTLFVPVAILFLAAAPALGLRDVAPGLLWSVLLLAAAGIAYGSVAAVFRAWPATLRVQSSSSKWRAPSCSLEARGS